MRILRKLRHALLVTALVTAGVASVPVPASAFGPSVLFVPSGECNRAYCTTYAKSVQTNTGRILASFEDDNQHAQGQTLPIFSSTDDGRSWKKIAAVADTSPRRWGSNWTNPYLYVLPRAIGGMSAGTVLLAGIASPPDRSGTAIELYRSNDDGFSWTWSPRSQLQSWRNRDTHSSRTMMNFLANRQGAVLEIRTVTVVPSRKSLRM